MPSGNRRPLYSEDDLQAATADVSRPETAAALPGPVSTSAATDIPLKQPCTLKGVASGAYAGMLGYFLGVVPAAIKFKGKQWGLIHGQGVASAGQLALMSGMYTAVHCICQRIRLVEDGWNRGFAGCSTGLVLGWKGGPWSALQSCAGLGLISALIDLGGGAVEAAEAAALCQLQQLGQQQQQHPLGELQQLLAMQLLSGAGSGHQRTEQRPAAAGTPAAAAADGQRAPAHNNVVQQQQQRQQPVSLQLLRPAATAMQQHLQQLEQLMAASPLQFLGACCQAGGPGSSSGSTAATTAAGPEAQVDACDLRSAGSPAAGKQQPQASRRQREQRQ